MKQISCCYIASLVTWMFVVYFKKFNWLVLIVGFLRFVVIAKQILKCSMNIKI